MSLVPPMTFDKLLAEPQQLLPPDQLEPTPSAPIMNV